MRVLNNYILFIFINFIPISSMIFLLDYNLNFRKLLIVITMLVVINLFLLISIKYLDVKKLLFFSVSLLPFWMRGANYIGVNIMPNNFYFLTFDLIFFNLISLFMILILFKSKKIKLDKIGMHLLLIVSIIFIGSIINLFLSNNLENELNIFFINIFTPSIFLVSLYLFFYNQSYKDNIYFLKAIRNLYFAVIIFVVIEVLFKGGALFSNPLLILEYGLRFGTALSVDGYGASIYSGGLRDMLYLAFFLAIFPVVGKLFLEHNILSTKVYNTMVGISVFFVFGIYSKTPIIILIISLLMVTSKIKLKHLVYIFMAIFIFFILIYEKLLERLMALQIALSYLFEGSFGMARDNESSAIGRILGIIDRYKEIETNLFIGQSSFVLIDNALIYLISIVGIIFSLIIVLLSIKIFLQLNKKSKQLFILLFLYTTFTFGNFFGIGNTEIYLNYNSIDEYVNKFGWLPSYTTANIYVSTIFIFLTLIITKLTKGLKHENNTSLSNKPI